MSAPTEADRLQGLIDGAKQVLDEIWRESQADDMIISDGGIMQDIVERVDRALDLEDRRA